MRLAALACHVPERRIDAEEIIAAAGVRRSDARVFTKVFGIERVAAGDAGAPLAERFSPVLHALDRLRLAKPIDTLIYVHGLPIASPPGHSPLSDWRRSHNDLLASVRLFYELDQHNCAGLFWALDMASRLLRAQFAQCVAIVAGDCLADFPISRRYVPGCTLIGDAFAGLVLDVGPGNVQIETIALSHRPEFAFGLYGSEAEMRRFNQAHEPMVTDALTTVDFRWCGEEAILPHNVNKLIWLPFLRKHRLDPGRVHLHLLRDVGHCYTTDPLLLLQRFMAERSSFVDTVSLLSVGLGAYVGACRIRLSNVPHPDGGQP
jgi:3-oxoacyl-[acyl-carrier-protein] synthase III